MEFVQNERLVQRGTAHAHVPVHGDGDDVGRAASLGPTASPSSPPSRCREAGVLLGPVGRAPRGGRGCPAGETLWPRTKASSTTGLQIRELVPGKVVGVVEFTEGPVAPMLGDRPRLRSVVGGRTHSGSARFAEKSHRGFASPNRPPWVPLARKYATSAPAPPSRKTQISC